MKAPVDRSEENMEGKQIIVPVKGGEIEYITYNHEEFAAFYENKHKGTGEEYFCANGLDPTSMLYCLPEFYEKKVNEKLKQGYVLIGADGECWIVAKPENLILTPMVMQPKTRKLNLDD